MTIGELKLINLFVAEYCRMNCETFANKIFFDVNYAVMGNPIKCIKCKLFSQFISLINFLGFFGCLNVIRCCCAENQTLIEQLDERLKVKED